jgi:hypothetical protein
MLKEFGIETVGFPEERLSYESISIPGEPSLHMHRQQKPSSRILHFHIILNYSGNIHSRRCHICPIPPGVVQRPSGMCRSVGDIPLVSFFSAIRSV